MKSKKTIYERLNENLDMRLKEFKKPEEAKELISSALALSRTIVYTLELSWGGPADGFKIFYNPDSHDVIEIIYYFSDWFEYEEKSLTDEEIDLIWPHIKPLVDF